ncbi:MAG TPA: 30S ribosomal protein S6 [Acidimicrobiaceae bacterium]|nr:30S ribosomal protein S6 [Acidimicrobiaceae bacterium]
MRTYELMVIFGDDLVDAALSKARDDVRRRVESVSTIVHEDFWGRRPFAYEIDHKTHGHYLVLETTAEAGALDPVESALRIADDIVRHKVIRLPDDEAARRITKRAEPPESDEEPTPPSE